MGKDFGISYRQVLENYLKIGEGMGMPGDILLSWRDVQAPDPQNPNEPNIACTISYESGKTSPDNGSGRYLRWSFDVHNHADKLNGKVPEGDEVLRCSVYSLSLMSQPGVWGTGDTLITVNFYEGEVTERGDVTTKGIVIKPDRFKPNPIREINYNIHEDADGLTDEFKTVFEGLDTDGIVGKFIELYRDGLGKYIKPETANTPEAEN